MSRLQILDLALAYDADPIAVRRAVAEWLARFGDYGQGVAASLLRREPRRHVWTSTVREAA